MTKDLREYLSGWNPELKTVVPAKKAGKNPLVINQNKLRESYDRASQRLNNAREQRPRTVPSPPRLQEVQVQQPFKSIANNIGCDGLDLQYIMEELAGSDNEALIKAFKQFMMIAKLSVGDAMERAAKQRRHVQNTNDVLKEAWRREVERVEKDNTEIQRELERAETAHRKIWIKTLDDLEAALEKDRVVENLHYFDQLFIESLRDKVGKGSVLIRDGKVYPNFKTLKMLKSQVGEEVLKRVKGKIEHHESVQVNRWLNSAKNADLLWEYMNTNAQELGEYEINNLMRIYLAHKKRVVWICRDGVVRDGGPWTEGTPKVEWEDHGYNRYNRSGTHTWDMNVGDVNDVLDLLDTYRRY